MVSRQRASIRPNFTSLNRWWAACCTGLPSLLAGIVLLDRRVVNIHEKSRGRAEVKRVRKSPVGHRAHMKVRRYIWDN
jgi:hypothetical protein